MSENGDEFNVLDDFDEEPDDPDLDEFIRRQNHSQNSNTELENDVAVPPETNVDDGTYDECLKEICVRKTSILFNIVCE